MSTASFDDATSKRLERMYGARDVVRRRQLVQEALAPAIGERILDVGCGPGFYEAEISPCVGPTGSVIGVDTSDDMLALARTRCAGLTNVEFRHGDAAALPVDDNTVDALVCVQVLEYVPDVLAAVTGMHRALRPGGRAVIWDVDWATVSWHASDPALMQRVLASWDRHLVHRSLPSELGALLRRAGFTNVEMTAHTFVTDELSPETYGGQAVSMVDGFVRGLDDVSADDLARWVDDQHALAERGEFFFSVTQFCFVAIKHGVDGSPAVDRCDECEFEYDLSAARDAPSAILASVSELAVLLRTTDDLRQRPEPTTWSSLEYGCHLRDVLLVQRERVLSARRNDCPSVDPMGRDERAEHDGYAEQDAQVVAGQLEAAASMFANVIARLGPAEWDRTLIYNYPTRQERSLRWLAAHTVHEVRHHLLDVQRQLSAVGD